jgi:hypothetical protein
MRERGFFETEAMSTRRKEVVKTITKVHISSAPSLSTRAKTHNHSTGMRGLDSRDSGC